MSKKARKTTNKSGTEAKETSPQLGPPPDRATLKRAKRFLKDVERLLQKHRSKVPSKDQDKLAAAMQSVRDGIAGSTDGKRLSTALKELDARAEQILGFAKKSTSREYAESIIVAVFIAVLLRSFAVEAFKIPTGSMIPTLAVGDHIFVNKFIYGLRIPLTNSWFVEWGTPDRGDVIVFRYPQDMSKDYIKRVVALAGDRVRVDGRDVYVNGNQLEREVPTAFEYLEEGPQRHATRSAMAFRERSQGTDLQYTVLYDPGRFGRGAFPSGVELPGLECGPNPDAGASECVVKEDFVFVMGDNRDNSSDSRFWGGVPTVNVKGKAMFIWMSFGRDPEDVSAADDGPDLVNIRWRRIGGSVH